MSLSYCSRYGYRFRDGLRAEFWWRVEHLGHYRGGDGGLLGFIRRLGYRKRKAAEHLAQPHRRRSWREIEATPQVMRPEQAQAYRHYFHERPEDPDERAWLRRRFGGQK